MMQAVVVPMVIIVPTAPAVPPSLIITRPGYLYNKPTARMKSLDQTSQEDKLAIRAPEYALVTDGKGEAGFGVDPTQRHDQRNQLFQDAERHGSVCLTEYYLSLSRSLSLCFRNERVRLFLFSLIVPNAAPTITSWTLVPITEESNIDTL